MASGNEAVRILTPLIPDPDEDTNKHVILLC